MTQATAPNAQRARRLAAYSAVAAATAAASGTANADEVVWDIPDILVSESGISAGVFFNMVAGTTSPATYAGAATYNIFYDFTPAKFRIEPRFGGYIYGPAYAGGAVGNLGFVGQFNTITTTTTLGATNTSQLAAATKLQQPSVSGAQDFVVSPPFFSNFYAYLDFDYGPIPFGDANFGNFGIRFQIGADTHYGWVTLKKYDSDNYGLFGFGYNDTPDTPSSPANTLDGSLLDNDGDIDDADLGTVFSNFTGPVGAAGLKTFGHGDTDGDGDIDDADLGNIFSAFTGPLAPLGPGASLSGTDGDGDIDDADLGTAFANFTGPVGLEGGKTATQGDTDGDGDIDDSDLATMFSAFTGPFAPVDVNNPFGVDNVLDIDPLYETIPGDPTGDGDIDDADLAIAFSNFTGPLGAAGGKTARDGDTDGDGDVDDQDLATMFSGFTGPLGPPSAAVPEPSSLVLLALGTAGFATRRQRHAQR